MTRKRTFMPANPFSIWLDLATKSSEMMMASAQVITSRTTQMAMSDMPPSDKDSKEFALMSSEKMEAASESFLAMSTSMFSLSPLATAKAFRQMSVMSNDMISLAFSQTPAQAMTRSLKLAGSMNRAGNSASRLGGHAAKMAMEGLHPIHKRAVANAKRLGK